MESMQSVCFGAFRFDPVNQCLWRGEHMVCLRPKSFAVLACLIAHAGRLVTKEELLDSVWPGVCVCDAVLKVCVLELRKALNEEVRSPRIILTVHRRGYRFIANVKPARHSVGDAAHRLRQPENHSELVGRGPIVAQLHEHLQLALQGTRQIVFITGEAGVGKSAVIDAFLDQIHAHSPVLTLHGQCVEQHATGEVYLPVLQALSHLCREPGTEHVPELIKHYAPCWLAQLPWLSEGCQRTLAQNKMPAAAHARMLREMGELCDALARTAPLIFVFEDLHYSDYATLDLLVWLAKQRDSARLLVLGTYQPVELIVRDHPLQAVKQELEPRRQCIEIALEFLTDSEVAAFLHRRFPGHTFPVELDSVIRERSGGNPLFIIKLIDELVRRAMLVQQSGGWHLAGELAEIQAVVPACLQFMIDKQFDRLNSEQQQVLMGASIAVREFTAARVAADLGQDTTLVEDCCAKLCHAQQFLRSLDALKSPDGTMTERYAFIHSLYRDVLLRRRLAEYSKRQQRAFDGWRWPADAAGTSVIKKPPESRIEAGSELQHAIDCLLKVVNNNHSDCPDRVALEYLTQGLQLLAGLTPATQAVAQLQLRSARP